MGNENNFGTDEKSTLVRVEQQLQDSVKNQTQIIEDLRTIFSRIETESKTISAIRANLKAHLESSPIRKEELNTKLKYIEERHTELKGEFVKFKDEVRTKQDKESENKDDGGLAELSKDYLLFKTEIKSAITTTRWIAVILIGSFGLIVSIFELLSYMKGLR